MDPKLVRQAQPLQKVTSELWIMDYGFCSLIWVGTVLVPSKNYGLGGSMDYEGYGLGGSRVYVNT